MKQILILSAIFILSNDVHAQTKTLKCSNASGTVQIETYQTTDQRQLHLKKSVVVIKTHNGTKALLYQQKDLIINGRMNVLIRKGGQAEDTNCNKMQTSEVYDYVDSFTLSRKDDSDLVPASAGEKGHYNIVDYFLCAEVKYAPSPCR